MQEHALDLLILSGIIIAAMFGIIKWLLGGYHKELMKRLDTIDVRLTEYGSRLSRVEGFLDGIKTASNHGQRQIEGE